MSAAKQSPWSTWRVDFVLLPIPDDPRTRELYEAWPKFQEAWGRKARKRWAESLEYILAERYPRSPAYMHWKTARTEAGKLP